MNGKNPHPDDILARCGKIILRRHLPYLLYSTQYWQGASSNGGAEQTASVTGRGGFYDHQGGNVPKLMF